MPVSQTLALDKLLVIVITNKISKYIQLLCLQSLPFQGRFQKSFRTEQGRGISLHPCSCSTAESRPFPGALRDQSGPSLPGFLWTCLLKGSPLLDSPTSRLGPDIVAGFLGNWLPGGLAHTLAPPSPFSQESHSFCPCGPKEAALTCVHPCHSQKVSQVQHSARVRLDCCQPHISCSCYFQQPRPDLWSLLLLGCLPPESWVPGAS